MRYARPVLTCFATGCIVSFFATLSVPAGDHTHPWLFLTPADLQRARAAAEQPGPLATLARQIAQQAATNRVEDLPPLETQWWQAASKQPWKKIYPAIFHHTFSVPIKWAEVARSCARANALSPSPELVSKAKRALLSLSDYTYEFDHYDVGMNYTIWTLAALEAYDLLYPEFLAAERARLDAFFDRYLAALRKSDDYWIEHEPGGRLNNHYAWHKLGLAMIGLFYDRPDLVERALHGPKGVEYMLEQGFKDDGLWVEGSIPYQFAETAPLVILAQLLENAHCTQDLFHYHSSNGRTLKGAYDALLPLLFPDRTLPPLGDAYARRPHIAEHPEWELLFRNFRSPAYAWLLSDVPSRTSQALFWGSPVLPSASPPPQPSKLWPEMGYIALRSDESTNYWSGRGWSAFATYSGQTVHDHADKLSLMLFAHGHLWLPDCEARSSAEHAFSSTVQATLNRETLCHNTLLVDGQSQRLTGHLLDLIQVTNTPSFKRAIFGDLHGRLYDGVRQLRTLIVCENYVLDLFQAASATPRDFAWLIHVDGAPIAAFFRTTNNVYFPTNAPWSYLSDARSASNITRLWECFSDGTHKLRLDILMDAPAEVVSCGFPRDDSSTPTDLPMRILTRHGTNAWFLALYRIVPRPDTPGELDLTTAASGRSEVTLRTSGKTYRYTVPTLTLDRMPSL